MPLVAAIGDAAFTTDGRSLEDVVGTLLKERGLVIAVATAFHVFLKYAKLWELERTGVLDAPGREAAAGKVRVGGPPAAAR